MTDCKESLNEYIKGTNLEHPKDDPLVEEFRQDCLKILADNISRERTTGPDVERVRVAILEAMNINYTTYSYRYVAEAAIAAMGSLSRTDTIESCADDGRGLPTSPLGSPTRYTDGTVSREYEGQASTTIQTPSVRKQAEGECIQTEHMEDASTRKNEERLKPLMTSSASDTIIHEAKDGVTCPSVFGSEIRYPAEVAQIIGRCVGVCCRLIVLDGKAEEHGEKCIDNLLTDLAPYLAIPMPVMVDLEKCAKALIDAQHYSHTQYDRAEDLKLHKPYWTDAVKAVLSAAGVVHE